MQELYSISSSIQSLSNPLQVKLWNSHTLWPVFIGIKLIPTQDSTLDYLSKSASLHLRLNQSVHSSQFQGLTVFVLLLTCGMT